MTDFRDYLCWDPAVADGAVNTEAVVASPAVFAATHTPLRIRRAQIRGRSLALMEGTVDENIVLNDFLSRKPDTGTLLMPVVGDTGTGKSHLVRWVRNNIPPSDNHSVIYLEKSRTSLKAVIGTLAGAGSTAPAELQDDIGSFSAGLDETALARRIINALNESLAQTTPGDMTGPARILAGTRGLASILSGSLHPRAHARGRQVRPATGCRTAPRPERPRFGRNAPRGSRSLIFPCKCAT